MTKYIIFKIHDETLCYPQERVLEIIKRGNVDFRIAISGHCEEDKKMIFNTRKFEIKEITSSDNIRLTNK